MESLIRSKKNSLNDRMYLYVIQPVYSGEEDGIDNQSDSWRGKIYYTHNMIKGRFTAITEKVQAIEKNLQSRIDRQSQDIREIRQILMQGGGAAGAGKSEGGGDGSSMDSKTQFQITSIKAKVDRINDKFETIMDYINKNN